MTQSTHVYAATLLGTPDIRLPLHADNPGAITLNSGGSPHVSGDIRLTSADAVLLNKLDTRNTPVPRIRIDVAAIVGGVPQTRTFDLCVRGTSRDQDSGEPVIELASDETLLEDFAQLTDDGNAFALAGSLRAVVNYVLNKVIPGAALEAFPAHDADMTPYWQVANLMPNPAGRGVVGNWIAGGANGNLSRETGWLGTIPGLPDMDTALLTTFTGNSGLGQGGSVSQTAGVVPYAPVSEGKTYTVYCLALAAVNAKNVRLAAQVFGSDGQVLDGGLPIVITKTLPTNTWTWVEGTVTTPVNAARLGPFLYPAAGTQWVNGETLRTTAWMLHEGTYPVRVPWFDGSTPSDAHYDYSAPVAHASAATRIPKGDSSNPEALIWRSGKSAMDFLTPLFQSQGLRLVCDEERRWTLRDENYSADGALSVRYAVNLLDGSSKISRESGIWFDAAVRRYKWRDRDGIEHVKEDTFALNDPPSMVNLMEIDAPYPGAGRAEYAVRRAQGRGREVSVTLVADWRTRAEQPTAIRLNGEPVQSGRIQQVTFDLSNDEMTVTDRTLEIGEGSIASLVGTINGLTGTINDL